MNHEGIKEIALFFFYSTLDAHQSPKWASRAADLYHSLRKHEPQLSSAAAIARATHTIWKRLSPQLKKGYPNIGGTADFILPENIDISPWVEFQKTANEDELLAVIWLHILHLPEKEVQLGITTSVGALRFRASRGLEKLGDLNQWKR